MNKYVVYTVIFNNYDTLKDPLVASEYIDYICFTDSNKVRSKIWDVRVVKNVTDNFSIENRKLKILAPFNELNNYDFSLYIDGSILIKGDLISVFKKYSIYNLVNFKHPTRDCIYDEILSCIDEKKASIKPLIEQFSDYKFYNMPVHFGLSDNKIIFRSNKCEKVKMLMSEWFNHVVKYSGRDQTCLSFVLYSNNCNYTFFDLDINNNSLFEVWPHRNEKIRMIWRKIDYTLKDNKITRRFIDIIKVYIKPLFIKMIYINSR